MDIVDNLLKMLSIAESCRNVTKYMQETETKRTFIPVTRTDELWFMVTAKANQGTESEEEGLITDYTQLENAFREVLEQQLLKSHLIYIHFSDMEYTSETYKGETGEVTSFARGKAKQLKLRKCKVTVEYQDWSILESESTDLADKLLFHTLNSEQKFKDEQADIKRRKFMRLEF